MKAPLELEKLAEDAAALLMSNASTDVWTVVKHQMSRLLSRSEPKRLARIEQQLDQLRQEVTDTATRTGGRQRLDHRSGLWQGRIIAALEDHPGAATELAELIALHSRVPTPTDTVHISDIRADGNATQIIVGKGDLKLEYTMGAEHRAALGNAETSATANDRR